jgi:hypothetical protein
MVEEAGGTEAMVNPNDFSRAVGGHSYEELAPYHEQHVAWSADGKTVLAHAPTLGDLYKQIEARGLREYVISFIPDPDISNL